MWSFIKNIFLYLGLGLLFLLAFSMKGCTIFTIHFTLDKIIN